LLGQWIGVRNHGKVVPPIQQLIPVLLHGHNTTKDSRLLCHNSMFRT
jgi:hypothetical protein